RDLVAKPLARRQLERLGADVTLDQPEQTGVRAALHVTHRALFLRREERQVVHLRVAIRQELALKIELTAAKQLGIDVPAHALGSLDAARIAGAIAVLLEDSLGGR